MAKRPMSLLSHLFLCLSLAMASLAAPGGKGKRIEVRFVAQTASAGVRPISITARATTNCILST